MQARATSGITSIIFDFGNVICTFDVMRFLRQLTPYTAHTFDDLRALLPALSESAIQYETGLIGSDEFFRRVTATTSLRATRDEFIRAYVDIFTPIPETLELIKRLKPCYRLGLLSNTNPWHFEYGIRTVEVFDLFDAVSLSYRVQAMKPDRRIYLHALGQLNTAPHTCVFIDDIPANVEAAKDLGMHGIHYTGHPSLMNSLRQLRIAVD